MNNTTAKELLELARHYEQFNINTQEIELLKKAANELEELEELQAEVDWWDLQDIRF